MAFLNKTDKKSTKDTSLETTEESIEANAETKDEAESTEDKAIESLVLNGGTLLPITDPVTILKFAGKLKVNEEFYSLFETSIHGVVAIKTEKVNEAFQDISADLSKILNEGR